MKSDLVPMSALATYYEKFIDAYEVTPDQNFILIRRLEDDMHQKEVPVFSADPNNGDLRILYPDLYGGVYTYQSNSKANPEKWFYRTRLAVPEGDKKYKQEAGSGIRPFFPKGIIEKYTRQEEIPVLFITEGEKKAFKAYQLGLDMVGIIGIHGYISRKGEKDLHEDLEELIRTCRVQTIVFLTDADTLKVTWADGKELSYRPATFLSAVSNFRVACDGLMNERNAALKKVYFMHLHEKLAETDKGLDDLLINQKIHTQDILQDLLKLDYATKYFRGFDLSLGNLIKVRSYFGLDNVEQFYNTYKEAIGFRDFNYKNRIYHFDGEKVRYVRHEDAGSYMRVGDQYYKTVKIPNKHGEPEANLRKWKKGEITSDYKKFPDFMDQIQKYDAFCNVPSNTDHYKRVHDKSYNIYEPIMYAIKPFEGDYESIKATLGFLKHIFGGVATADKDIKGDIFTIGLDLLTIMFQRPTQMLPVLCLVSPENNTGKSTFLKWQKDIYGANATILGNEQFKQAFNSHYITKFIIGIDEGFIDADKKSEKERLKKLVTDDRQFLEFKGVDVQEIDFFGKVIICSNDADRLMKIDEGEIRWLIIRVPKLYQDNPFLREQMLKEIPYWLGFLEQRKIFHPRENRAWFHPQYLITDQLKRVIEVTRSSHEKLIDDFVRDTFERFDLLQFMAHKDYILETINKAAKYKISADQLKSYLKDKKGLDTLKSATRIKIPLDWIIHPSQEQEILWKETVQKPYVFKREDWYSLEEMQNLGMPKQTESPISLLPNF